MDGRPPHRRSYPLRPGASTMADGEIAWRTTWKSEGPIYEDESRDIYAEVWRVLGEGNATEWLQEPNTRFGGRTPQQVIEDGEEHWVRDVLRSYLYIGSS